jgi:hypothetical protein
MQENLISLYRSLRITFVYMFMGSFDDSEVSELKTFFEDILYNLHFNFLGVGMLVVRCLIVFKAMRLRAWRTVVCLMKKQALI